MQMVCVLTDLSRTTKKICRIESPILPFFKFSLCYQLNYFQVATNKNYTPSKKLEPYFEQLFKSLIFH